MGSFKIEEKDVKFAKAYVAWLVASGGVPEVKDDFVDKLVLAVNDFIERNGAVMESLSTELQDIFTDAMENEDDDDTCEEDAPVAESQVLN